MPRQTPSEASQIPKEPVCPLCNQKMERTANYPNIAPHYRCRECRVIFAWELTEFIPCPTPELHVPIVWHGWGRE